MIVGVAGIAQLFSLFMTTYRERIHELEILSSIGMSQFQKRKMCLKEGAIIATIRSNYRHYSWVCFINSYNRYTSKNY